MKRAAFLCLLLLLCLLSGGCGDTAFFELPSLSGPMLEWPPVTVLGAMETPAPTAAPERKPAEPVPYTVLYEKRNLPAAMYEPDGCLLSAQISMEQNGGLSGFERATGRKHAVFAYEMRVDDPFPEEWILNCMAAQAAPMILLQPGGDGTEFSIPQLTELAARLGAYNMPVFMVFYPLSADPLFDEATYALYYRYARLIFSDYAPKAAFVWSVDPRLAHAASYYPGDEAVDWVGFTLTARYQPEGSHAAADTAQGHTEGVYSAQGFDQADDNAQGNEGYDPAVWAQLDALYQRYQDRKPLMLTGLAVSHFSSRDYTYHIKEASAELERIYRALISEYPRIKLVNYKSMDEMADGVAGDYADNFSLTGDDILLTAYRDVTGDRHFLSALAMEDPPSSEWLRSAYTGYEWEGRYFIDVETLTKDLRLFAPLETAVVAGRRCADVRTYHEDAYIFTNVDPERQIIHIYIKNA